MSIKLYEITSEIALIVDSIMEAQGELPPELEQRFDECNLALPVKAEGIRKVLLNMDADVNALDEEIKRLKKLKEVRVNATKRLKTYIHRCMESADLKKIETPLGGFTVCKGKDTANPTYYNLNGKDTPLKYRKVVPKTWTPDKVLILNTLQNGKKVRGWKIIESPSYLKVR